MSERTETPDNDPDVAEILASEREALDRWGKGDPSGFLEISARDVVYFDPMIPRRIDGLDALTDYYDKLRGMIRVERDEILNAHVQRVDRMAVLTFNYVSYGGGEDGMRWNCTEVYRKDPEGWRIIQTHWSRTA